MTDTTNFDADVEAIRDEYRRLKRRRALINHALDAAALAFVLATIYLAWLVLA